MNPKPLSPTMQKVLDRIRVGTTTTAYDEQASLATLDALVERGYLTRKILYGAAWSPRNQIEYTRVK
jgi:hypothetical protein